MKSDSINRRIQGCGVARALLMVASLFCLMGQSYIAIGCQVHELDRCMQQDDGAAVTAPADDDCHLCCCSTASGHVCAHGVMMTTSPIRTAFTPQYALMLPHFSLRADAQFIPLGAFRPPTSV